jgi:hypothetical protein
MWFLEERSGNVVENKGSEKNKPKTKPNSEPNQVRGPEHRLNAAGGCRLRMIRRAVATEATERQGVSHPGWM